MGNSRDGYWAHSWEKEVERGKGARMQQRGRGAAVHLAEQGLSGRDRVRS